jgi:hypothetical protein
MLDTLAQGGATDLVVETWITEGKCGKQERQVVRKVEKTTERPAETENEVIRLLKRAKGLGVQPHILTVGCSEYEKLLDAKKGGKLDLEKLLDLITRHLRQKTLKVLRARARSKAPNRCRSRRSKRPRGRGREEAQAAACRRGGAQSKKPMVAIYGGALHNDLYPLEELEMFSFGGALKKATGGRYLELDLYVPEYVEADEQLRKKPWYPLLRKQPRNRVLLIERGRSSYVLVLKPENSSSSQRGG